ncbi:GILT-like protein 1 [Diabrotica undecimpunctata]|uniref:GILT-like protein 1 n=1 Tax=Diabrotica undecimpunctata TaxID=50387 RepID=UPI003B6367C0
MFFFTSYLYALLVLLVTSSNAQEKKEQKVTVRVYYESLCPFAKAFIVNQLSPTMKGNLSRYVNLELVPYGKTTQVRLANGTTQYNCHHGIQECYGNRIQACVDTHIAKSNQAEYLSFVSCFMGNLTTGIEKKQVDDALQRCVRAPLDVDEIRNCTTSASGDKLIENNANITNRFQNPLRNVPTIVLNGIYSESESSRSENNFKSVLCSKINWEKPKECANLPNKGGESNKIYIGTLFIALLSILCV